MGCVSSKPFTDDFNQEILIGHGSYTNHVVSLTSSTYGVLKLDQESVKETIKETTMSRPHLVSPKLQRMGIEDPEVINAWKLMEDLEDQISISVQAKNSPKSRVADADASNPSKFLSEINSPKKQKKFAGKENKQRPSGDDGAVRQPQQSPKQVLKPFSSLENVQKTTSTFSSLENVRSIIESHRVHMIERDISMDSGLREELRRLIGSKEVKVPIVFVKGRLIGGADEVVKMEEEGKWEVLIHGISRALAGCEGCGGIRFLMCMDCSGSCKVLDENSKKMVKCGECNEKGLIQCPICC